MAVPMAAHLERSWAAQLAGQWAGKRVGQLVDLSAACSVRKLAVSSAGSMAARWGSD
jgi:hypothetical protein